MSRWNTAAIHPFVPVPDLCRVSFPLRTLIPIIGLCPLMLQAQVDDVTPADSLEMETPASVEPIITGGVPEPALRARDTLDWRQRHSPKRAMLYSAVLPGGGQIYNRKYWKAPIAWAGIGACVWFIQDNGREYRRYRNAYIALTDDDPDTVDEFGGIYTPGALLNASDTYRRWRELSYIALSAVYILNIIDASVDANFVRFDVSPDLSMGLGPAIPLAAQGAAGLSITVSIR